jgi:hypothetical protein
MKVVVSDRKFLKKKGVRKKEVSLVGPNKEFSLIDSITRIYGLCSYLYLYFDAGGTLRQT